MKEGCDGCGANGETHRLEYKKGVGAQLCKKCWKKEMRWRKLQNKNLPLKEKYDILPFPI